MDSQSLPAKPESNGTVGSLPPSPHRPYGIDTSTAGTLQERYFMVLAGLIDKNLAVQLEIRDQLVKLNKNLERKPRDAK